MAEDEDMLDAHHVSLIAREAAEKALENAKPTFQQMAYDVGRKLTDESIIQFHQTFKHVFNVDINSTDEVKNLQKVLNHAEDSMNGQRDARTAVRKGIIGSAVSFVTGLVVAFFAGKH